MGSSPELGLGTLDTGHGADPQTLQWEQVEERTRPHSSCMFGGVPLGAVQAERVSLGLGGGLGGEWWRLLDQVRTKRAALALGEYPSASTGEAG